MKKLIRSLILKTFEWSGLMSKLGGHIGQNARILGERMDKLEAKIGDLRTLGEENEFKYLRTNDKIEGLERWLSLDWVDKRSKGYKKSKHKKEPILVTDNK